MIALFASAILSAAGAAGGMLEKLESSMLLEAEFEQIDYWALTRETEAFSGHLILCRDGKFLLDYSDPAGREMGFDGEMLYTVDPLYRQVLLDDSSEPASFTALLESVENPDLSSRTVTNGDTVTVEVSGDIGQGISRMDFSYLLSDSLPRVLTTFDHNGNMSNWILRSVVVSDEDPGDVFDLVIPGGYEVMRAGDL